MPRPMSKLAPGWWDYTTLDPDLLAEAAASMRTKQKSPQSSHANRENNAAFVYVRVPSRNNFPPSVEEGIGSDM